MTGASSDDVFASSPSVWPLSQGAEWLRDAARGSDKRTGRRRRQLAAAVAVTGTGLLGASLSTKPASRGYALTFSVAGTWLVGGLAVEPIDWASLRGDERSLGRLVVVPVLTGAAAFGAFFGCRFWSPGEFRFSMRPSPPCSSTPRARLGGIGHGDGARQWSRGEEVFFRGSLFSEFAPAYPVAGSTAAYMLTTVATRNPALVVASGVMGGVFAVQLGARREASWHRY